MLFHDILTVNDSHGRPYTWASFLSRRFAVPHARHQKPCTQRISCAGLGAQALGCQPRNESACVSATRSESPLRSGRPHARQTQPEKRAELFPVEVNCAGIPPAGNALQNQEAISGFHQAFGASFAVNRKASDPWRNGRCADSGCCHTTLLGFLSQCRSSIEKFSGKELT